jgi:3-(3-hydroxy-phenyl)propionate hydroxylase
MAEFRREHEIGIHGFPQANMFHQPDLETCCSHRAGRHPLIDFHRGAEVTGMDGTFGPLTGGPVEVHAELAPDGSGQTFTGRLVLGCDGANSSIRGHCPGSPWKTLGFTERWLVIDIRSEKLLDTWDGVEQICDPPTGPPPSCRSPPPLPVGVPAARRRRRGGHDHPGRLGRLLEPWTGAPGPWTAWRSPAAHLHLPGPAGTRFQAGASSSSATPPTSPRRSSARAWRQGSATPTTSPGRSHT